MLWLDAELLHAKQQCNCHSVQLWLALLVRDVTCVQHPAGSCLISVSTHQQASLDEEGRIMSRSDTTR